LGKNRQSTRGPFKDASLAVTIIEASSLISPELLVEIEADAIISNI